MGAKYNSLGEKVNVPGAGSYEIPSKVSVVLRIVDITDSNIF